MNSGSKFYMLVDDEPIAESEGIFFSADFDVEVEESETYTVTVTGENTKGSVKFVVESAG